MGAFYSCASFISRRLARSTYCTTLLGRAGYGEDRALGARKGARSALT